MKKYFLTGLTLLLPMVICVLIIKWLIDLLTAPFLPLAQAILSYSMGNEVNFALARHHFLALALTKILVLLTLIIVTFLLGLFGQTYAQALVRGIFLRIPLIRVLYRLLEDMTKAAFPQDAKTFQETVLVPFPHKDSLALGLVAKEAPSVFQEKDPALEIAVFVPTSPHPASGFILLTPRKHTKPLNLSTEEAFQFIVSCGTSHPTS